LDPLPPGVRTTGEVARLLVGNDEGPAYEDWLDDNARGEGSRDVVPWVSASRIEEGVGDFVQSGSGRGLASSLPASKLRDPN
jgi:hypothetical protein